MAEKKQKPPKKEKPAKPNPVKDKAAKAKPDKSNPAKEKPASGKPVKEKPAKTKPDKAKPTGSKKEATGKKEKKPGVPLTVLAKKAIPYLLVLLGVLLIVLTASIVRIGTDPSVPYGVEVESISAGGLLPDEVDDFLQTNWPDPMAEELIVLYAEGYERTVSYGELGVTIDRESLGQKLLAIGQEGWVGKRVLARAALLGQTEHLAVPVRFDADRMDQVLQEVHEALHREATGAKLLIQDKRVTVTTGRDGLRVDTGRLADSIIALLDARKSGRIFVPTLPIRSPPIDAAPVLKAINVKATSAKKSKDADGNPIVVPSVTGRHIDPEVLAEELGKLDTRSDRRIVERELPVTFTEPEVMTEDLTQSESSSRVGGQYETYLTHGTETDRNRAHNILLAANALDGMTIPAGGEFSFNGATGPRTAEAGYVEAPVYADGRITTGLGGGICQVSTTACNAMLEAGLEPLERHAHMFTVGYASPGLDASVAYGLQDLRFGNPYDAAVTLQVSLEGECLRVSVLIPAEEEIPAIRVYTRTLSIEPASVRKIADLGLAPGEEALVEAGMDGFTVETWLQRYMGGNLQQEAKLFDSRYLAHPALVHVGASPTPPQS